MRYPTTRLKLWGAKLMLCTYTERGTYVLASAMHSLRAAELDIAACILRRKKHQAPSITFAEDLKLKPEELEVFLKYFNTKIKGQLSLRKDIPTQAQLESLDDLHLLVDEMSGFSPK